MVPLKHLGRVEGVCVGRGGTNYLATLIYVMHCFPNPALTVSLGNPNGEGKGAESSRM
jgi:hypothetical protein